MTPESVLAAAAFVSILGLALFKRKKEEEPKKPVTAPAPPAAPAAKPAKPAEPEQPVLKAFVLNRKGELVGELAVETEIVDVGYEEVLQLLDGKGLAKTTRLESAPYTVHILREGDYFMVAFTRSPDDGAVLATAQSLLQDTVKDLT